MPVRWLKVFFYRVLKKMNGHKITQGRQTLLGTWVISQSWMAEINLPWCKESGQPGGTAWWRWPVYAGGKRRSRWSDGAGFFHGRSSSVSVFARLWNRSGWPCRRKSYKLFSSWDLASWNELSFLTSLCFKINEVSIKTECHLPLRGLQSWSVRCSCC